jgi:glycosyltransferase involved in cell wall biosynthesis
MATEPKRVTLVADEMLGYVKTGGIGTATTFLAVALARMGHQVELLYVGEPPSEPLASNWAGLYEQAGVTIRLLPRSDEQTEPSCFARMLEVERALLADSPDIVIVQDLAAPAYTALRKRQLGLAFERTLFVVHCHGTRQWITDMAGKARVLPGALVVSVLEQASVELADVAVSPSAYLVDWMTQQGWRLPEQTLVIPYLSRSAATGEPQPWVELDSRQVERLAFFGRLEERKGLRPFAAGLNALAPQLLAKVELEFLGAATPAWPRERIEGLLSETAKKSLRGITFATDLDQPEALERLARPGTLAVMPSRGETFSNAVYECLQRGIPFIAADAGAPAELVATEDRERVLFKPTAAGVAAALERVLTAGEPLRPAQPAFEADRAYTAWAKVVALQTPAREPRGATELTDDWVVLLAPGDTPREDLTARLLQAQAASGADIVTCGVRLESGVQRHFLGDPGGLGILGNHYGTTALVRRALLAEDAEPMPRWSLLAGLVLAGAKIVAVPEALVERRGSPEDESAALQVVQEFERRLPSSLRSLARLAAGLAAQRTGPARPRRRRLFGRR